MVDCALSVTEGGMMQAARCGEVWRRKGNRHPASAPCNSFLCGDGYVMLAVAHDKQWASLSRIIGREDLITDPRTATVAARKVNEAFVEQLVAEWTSQRTRQEVVTTLNAESIAVSPVLDFGDIIREPHFREREIVCEVEHPTAGTLTHYGVAPKFAKTPARVRAAAPRLGQDNAEIYNQWLGFDESILEELRKEGAI
jgi:crotonobetainyl-CoA:carnitine CoA-transferase CaiB-like acyl-CoA transferase